MFCLCVLLIVLKFVSVNIGVCWIIEISEESELFVKYLFLNWNEYKNVVISIGCVSDYLMLNGGFDCFCVEVW